MEVQRGPRLDLDVAQDTGGTGEPQSVLVSNAGEIRDRPGDQAQFFEKSLPVDVLFPLFEQNPAAGALSQAVAVENLVHSGVKLDAGPEGLFAEVGPLGDLDRLFLVDELHGRHGRDLILAGSMAAMDKEAADDLSNGGSAEIINPSAAKFQDLNRSFRHVARTDPERGASAP
jgi:hypothetical protein